jgi:hypothetical protein
VYRKSIGKLLIDLVIQREYVVLALEASAGNHLVAAGLCLFVALPDRHRYAPISFFKVIDDRAGDGWQLARINGRWLIGYPFMLDLDFQIGLERNEDPSFKKKYRECIGGLIVQ